MVERKLHVESEVDGYSDQNLVKYQSNYLRPMLVGKVTFRTNQFFCCFYFDSFGCEFQGVKDGSQHKQKEKKFGTFYILPVIKAKMQASWLKLCVNAVYSPDTVTANYAQFWFHRFCSGMPVAENVDKITEIIEVDRHVSCRSIVQELKMNLSCEDPLGSHFENENDFESNKNQ
ncbi:hypothetical protein TNCV_3310491 [Trichonephila clavipes]|nr:hypothetical protein TNCV_3310491 [Trichonephila clavipes]